jgi:hypothetical protein
MNTDDARSGPSPRPLLYRRAYELACASLADSALVGAGTDPAGLMRRLVAEVEAELGDHAEARAAIEDGVRDAVTGREPTC